MSYATSAYPVLNRVVGFACILLAIWNSTVHGESPDRNLSSAEILLSRIPAKTEAVFCVNGRLEISVRPDLSKANPFDLALHFTTELALQCDDVLRLSQKEVRCCVSMVRGIRPPKEHIATGTSMGEFQTKRCELVFVERPLVDSWIEDVLRDAGEGVASLIEKDAFELRSADQSLFVARVSEKVICIGNDRKYFDDVLAVCRDSKSDPSALLQYNKEFRRAISFINHSSPFWAIRCFGKSVDRDDVTSIKSRDSVVGIYDEGAEFVVLERRDLTASICRIHVASIMIDHCEEQFRAALGDVVVKVGVPRTEMPDVRLIECDWSKADDSSAMFVGICALFGHGRLP